MFLQLGCCFASQAVSLDIFLFSSLSLPVYQLNLPAQPVGAWTQDGKVLTAAAAAAAAAAAGLRYADMRADTV